jgi:putative membrane protein
MTTSDRSDVATILLLVVGAFVLVPLLTMGLGYGGMMGHGGMIGHAGMMSDYGGYGISPLWGLAMMLVWVLVIVGGAYLLYRLVTSNQRVGSDNALEELRVEYARGNVTEEEFEERREKLKRD